MDDLFLIYRFSSTFICHFSLERKSRMLKQEWWHCSYGCWLLSQSLESLSSAGHSSLEMDFKDLIIRWEHCVHISKNVWVWWWRNYVRGCKCNKNISFVTKQILILGNHKFLVQKWHLRCHIIFQYFNHFPFILNDNKVDMYWAKNN